LARLNNPCTKASGLSSSSSILSFSLKHLGAPFAVAHRISVDSGPLTPQSSSSSSLFVPKGSSCWKY
jgi:hypothetical protein